MTKKNRSGTNDGPLGRGDLVLSLLFIFPIFAIYQLGVIFSPTVNGVDFVTSHLYAAVGRDRQTYLLVQLGLVAVYAGTVIYLRFKRTVDFGAFVPMLIESAIYALTLGSLIVFVMDRLLGLAIGEIGQIVVTSAGAGVYEELVFRVGLFAGTTALLRRLGVDAGLAVIASLAGSAALFSFVHHLGPLGDPFAGDVFIYRMLAGVFLGAIFYYRSLAHAVYAHFLYDVYVQILR